MKKKLIYVLHDFKSGGVEVALLSAFKDLENSFVFRLIVLGFTDSEFIESLNKYQKNKIISFPFKTIFFPFYMLKAIKYIFNFKPDILISSLWRSNLIGSISKKLNKKIIFVPFIHSTYFFHYFDKLFSGIALKLSDNVFVDSYASKRIIESRYTNLYCEVISFVINKNKIELPNVKIKDRVKFLFIGRINWVKKIPLAIKFVKDLQSHGYDVQFDIYGPDDGDLKNVLNEIEKQNARKIINLKGHVSLKEKKDLFKNYNFYIQFSQYEGMAMSIVEAMQNGLVCIVNPVGEIPNYSYDMLSAIHINTNMGTYTDKDLIKAINVINKPEIFGKISASGFDYFKAQPLYRESLVREINKLINDKYMN